MSHLNTKSGVKDCRPRPNAGPKQKVTPTERPAYMAAKDRATCTPLHRVKGMKK